MSMYTYVLRHQQELSDYMFWLDLKIDIAVHVCFFFKQIASLE